uniref:Uncharacterized protein n=1 Tax=Anguilla anguilla TaxID=7936 RepID=A0A0E9VEJ7_ANGAN
MILSNKRDISQYSKTIGIYQLIQSILCYGTNKYCFTTVQRIHSAAEMFYIFI